MKSQPKYQKQENKEYFSFSKYVHEVRWQTYYHQIIQILKIAEKLTHDKHLVGRKNTIRKINVLEIGPADRSVSSILNSQGINTQTMDIDPELKPDYVGSLPNIPPTKPRVFDCILCCQVLEHINYVDSERALAEFAKRSRYAVISVPHKGINFYLSLKIWFLKTIKLSFTFPSPKKHIAPGNHYWELGVSGYTESRWRKSIEKAGFEILDSYRMPEFTFYHFYILKSLKNTI